MIQLFSGAVALGLLSALSWGSGDFCGGLAAKRANPVFVVFASQLVGATLLAVLAVVFGEPLPGVEVWAWAAAAGLAGAFGLVALYTGLAQGMMGVVAPVSGVVGAAVPIVVAAVTVGLPGALPLAGFALALLSVWLLSGGAVSQSTKARSSGLRLALIAGTGFGLFFVFLDQAAEVAIWWPLVIARGMACLALAPFLLRSARHGGLGDLKAALPFILLAGVLDSGGNLFFGLAAQIGRLDMAAVLSSLYSAVTVGLAWLFLRERLTRPQWAGVAAALIAIPLIAA
ncbi:MAG: EamA family transporter [Caldilineaceae bacterium]